MPNRVAASAKAVVFKELLGSWQYGKPPNETPVEVELEQYGKIVIVQAFYGRDGTFPHWKTELGTCLHPTTFARWRIPNDPISPATPSAAPSVERTNE